MNPHASPYAAAPALKLPRRNPSAGESTSAFSTDMGGQLAADLEGLREREANLRDYEVRLRNWQAQLDAAVGQPAAGGATAPFLRASSSAPFASDTGLEAAWAKFHRARALLEAEQNQMRDDRISLRETELTLKRREAELEEREAQIAAREQQFAAQFAGLEAADSKKSLSAVQRFTQAPFLVAKAVFKPAK
jgi:hypothetical protein